MTTAPGPEDPAGSRPPVDPDIDLHVPGQRIEWRRHRFVLPAIAVGGMVGASARYAAGRVWPTGEHAMPWTTMGINAVGCLLIGALMVAVVEVGGTHPLLRPFVGVGVLGGFTTFSTYAVDVVSLLDAGRPGLALGTAAGTLVVALGAVVAGVAAGRAVVRRNARRAA